LAARNNVHGQIRDDYNEKIPAQKPPTWLTLNANGTYTVTAGVTGVTTFGNVQNDRTFEGGVNGPARYIVSQIRLSGNKTVTFANPSNVSTSEIEIYIDGNMSTKGGGNSTDPSDGSFVIQPGVKVKIYVKGEFDVGGNAINNVSGRAANLSLYGVNATTAGALLTTTPVWSFRGASQYVGTVYAPGAHIELNGGGNTNRTYIGSIVAKSARMTGNVKIRYDEALAADGVIIGFELCSWFEDTKKDCSF
jgi:hypothetical protein